MNQPVCMICARAQFRSFGGKTLHRIVLLSDSLFDIVFIAASACLLHRSELPDGGLDGTNP